MNRILINFMFVGFVGIAVFGFLAMGHSTSGWCLAEAMNRSVCPTNVFEAVSFYSNTFINFSLGILPLGWSLAVLLSAFVLSFSAVFFASIVALFSSVISENLAANILFFSKRKLSHWLSLHENSPTVHKTAI